MSLRVKMHVPLTQQQTHLSSQHQEKRGQLFATTPSGQLEVVPSPFVHNGVVITCRLLRRLEPLLARDFILPLFIWGLCLPPSTSAISAAKKEK